MGDEDEGQSVLGLEVLHEIEDLRLDRDVKRRDHLVTDQHLGLHDQCASNTDSLALSTGKFPGIAIPCNVWVKAHCFEHLSDGGSPLVTCLGLPDVDRFGDDIVHSSTWIQGRYGVLEDHLYRGAGTPQLASPEARQPLSCNKYFTRRGLLDAYDRSTGGRLATTRLSDQSEGLTFVDIEGDSGDSLNDLTTLLEADGQVLDTQQRCGLSRHQFSPLAVVMDPALPVWRGFQHAKR